METEFHYYLTGIIAHAAGFTQKDAKIIASASEYTDENDNQIRVLDRRTDETYENYISQTMNILKPKQKLMRIYPIFHFVPGEPDLPENRRRDGKMHRLNTTPANRVATELLDEALQTSGETRLYRIGIATHAFADSWAHQNFVGWYDFFNNIALDPKPDIGHADAEHHPDWVAHRWDDIPLVHGEIDNTVRFLEAAEAIYKRYRHHLNTRNIRAKRPWQDLRGDLENVMQRSFSGCFNCHADERLQHYQTLAPWLKTFDKDQWQDTAIERSISDLICEGCWYVWRDDVQKEDTYWYRFQEAVKDHQALAMNLLEPIFSTMGADLHKH